MKKVGRLLLSTILFSAWFAHPSLCEETFRPALSPRLELNGKLGNKRNIGVVEAWIPLKQDSYNGQVLYSDLRFMRDNIDNDEGNLGIGYRTLSPRIDAITGAYAYFDRRHTSYNNTFHQMTLGGEIMGEDQDLRLNAYIPLSGKKTWQIEAPGHTGPYLADNGIYYDETGANQVEEPLTGFDLELGQRLPIFEDQIDSFRVFGAVYGFYGDKSDDVEGIRARFQADISENISVGSRIQHDAVRGTQSFAELTLRFPNKKSFRKHGLYSRLDESPERDVDIVSNTHVESLGQKNIAITNKESGEAQKVYYVDNSNASDGDGTIENPFRELAYAEAVASAHDIIYVGQGDGTSNYQDLGVTLAYDGMRLIGSGVDFSFDGTRFNAGNNAFEGLLLKAASANAVITNTGGNGLMISGDNVEVQGVSIVNALGDGIYATGSNALVSNISLNGNGGNGFHLMNANGVNISSSVFNNNSQAGISIEANGSSLDNFQVHDNTFSGNYNSFRAFAENGAVIDNVDISDNRISDFMEKSVYLISDGTGSVISNSLIQGNHFTINGAEIVDHEGVSTVVSNGGVFKDLDISNNIFENVRCSVCIVGRSGGDYVAAFSINDNQMTGGNLAGIYADISGSGSNLDSISINRNEMDNKVHGIFIMSSTGALINATDINENIITNSFYTGITINAMNANFTNVELTSNVTNDTGDIGLSVNSQSGAQIGSLLIADHLSERNANGGIFVGAYTAGKIGPVIIRDSIIRNGGGATSYGALTIISTNTGSTMGNVLVERTMVTGNQRDGVYVREGSGANFTGLVDFGGGGLSSGQNSFYGNRLSNSSTYKDFRSWGGTLSVLARQNWWGQATGPAAGQTLATSSTLSTTGYLVSAP